MAERLSAGPRTSAAPRRRRAPLPRVWPIRASDVFAFAVGNAVLILLMWVRHGGLGELGSISGALTAIGQVTALLGTYLALIQIVLMSRSPWLDQQYGMERIAFWHRWVGFSCIWLLVAHAFFTTLGYALGDGSTFFGEAWTLLTTYPYVLMGTVALALLVGVGFVSMRAAQKRISYETWYGIHLYVYLAIALGFGHELVVGSDFANDPVARGYWIALYVLTLALIVIFRVSEPIRTTLRHRFRVANVVQEAPDTVSVYVTGRDLDRLPVRAGQYFIWRFLHWDGWWRAHPFSLSAAPNGEYLRLTIKGIGDYSRRLLRLKPGTPVFAEGPYGALTGARRRRSRVLLIAGGIGITPLRALMEELPAGRANLTLLYRARDWNDVVFREELEELARERGARIQYLVGSRGTGNLPDDPLGPASLRRLVPDVRQRDIYICGPIPMMEAVKHNLHQLRVPPAQIHTERFSY